jgi:hypothetical protein
MFIISIEGSLTLIGVLPGAATFAKSGWGKIRAERPFRLTLLRWGLPSLAKPEFVRALGLFELTAAALAVASVGVGLVAALPLIAALALFGGALVWRRPAACGCGGVLDARWQLAVVRNLFLILLVLSAPYWPQLINIRRVTVWNL